MNHEVNVTYRILILILALSILVSCGGEKDAPEPVPAGPAPLTEIELKNGIGPITKVELGPIDQVLADSGKVIFDVKCVACHKLEERLVGPPIKGVTERRSPEFIMNMILNPDEMVKRHPEVKAMLATYYVPMTFQNVSEDEARSILEYLRTVNE